MPVSFLVLAQTCAAFVSPETLAGVVSLESGFAPFNIRINSGLPLKQQPATKAEAIEVATSLVAEQQDIQLGLGGISLEDLRKSNLSIADAFDPCLNLKTTAHLLDGYYRHAIEENFDPVRAEKRMLRSWYGRGDALIGEIVRYDEQVFQKIKQLRPTMAKLVIENAVEKRGAVHDSSVAAVTSRSRQSAVNNASEEPAFVPPVSSWDVFRNSRNLSVLVFENNQKEQSE
ncbi:lytic transglycosylase domain-containing protein [Brucella anthropi]|uniref:type IV secretion system protein VirB1 n=1 Tax=Brucella anthropi TaxID=529 RepID=UPI000F669015|nr:type IV secretion system protein VirB1 [Brucella anthropi]KAB2764118.1 lytic transglycosylase domain-containing protein [Brucella anthropi]RRY17128.1 type IV secretion system protein VirB1 [Brucella anthropi]